MPKKTKKRVTRKKGKKKTIKKRRRIAPKKQNFILLGEDLTIRVQTYKSKDLRTAKKEIRQADRDMKKTSVSRDFQKYIRSGYAVPKKDLTKFLKKYKVPLR